MEVKRSIRIDENLYNDIARIAEERGANSTLIIKEALKMYRDKHYLEQKASVISREVQEAIKAEMELISSRDMNKVRSILSAMAINVHVLQRVIAEELNVNGIDLVNYRQEAIEVLREHNRVFDLREFVD